MSSGRVRHHPPVGDRRQLTALSDLVAVADQLLASDTPFDEVVPALVEALGRIPMVRAAEIVRAGAAPQPGTPSQRGASAGGSRILLGDPAGTAAVRVELEPGARDEPGLVITILSLLEVICAYRGAVGPRPRPGITTRSGSAVVVVWHSSGNPVAVGDTISRVLGYTDVNTHVAMRSLVHPDDRDMWITAFSSTVAEPGTVVELDARVRHASGRWVVLSVSMVNLLEHPGVDAVVLYGRDVTERRAVEDQARIERARLREVVRQLAGGVAIDDGHHVIMTNAVLERLFAGGGSWFGTPVADFVERVARACQDSATTRALLARMVESGRPTRGLRLELDGGKVVVCDLVPLGRAAAKVLGRFWYFRDVTAEAAARTELEEHNRALAEAAALKGQFVATVSHELRSPLAAILSFVELLEDSRESLSSEQAQHLDVISRNAARLVRLVNDLLLLSRLETNQLSMSFADIGVADLLAEAGQELAAIAASREITLRVSAGEGPPIRADQARLTQVLDNLVGNALKFTPPGGMVRLAAQAGESGWRISVSDTGIGIPEAELPGLFHPFVRASNATAAGVPGSGLGLSICQQIIELHDGTIGISSMPGAGTTVEITLPYPDGPGERLAR